MKKIALVSHGCAKNLVDSELILGILAQNGYKITLNEDESDTVIVNTCSFICDAERESIRSILELIDKGKRVIVTGCLSQKHPDELKKEIPEISAVVGTTDFTKIVDIIESKTYVCEVNRNPEYIYPENIERQQITMGASSYIKIADGCNYRCGYCIIPYLLRVTLEPGTITPAAKSVADSFTTSKLSILPAYLSAISATRFS